LEELGIYGRRILIIKTKYVGQWQALVNMAMSLRIT
jgi:hypothetical protein